jgi:hypothetical protein
MPDFALVRGGRVFEVKLTAFWRDLGGSGAALELYRWRTTTAAGEAPVFMVRIAPVRCGQLLLAAEAGLVNVFWKCRRVGLWPRKH